MESTHSLAEQLRGVPSRAAQVIVGLDDSNLRARPGADEWSAVEVVGHLVDKLTQWAGRARRAALEDDPVLDPYDQDSSVLAAGYQEADPVVLLGRLLEAAERFARQIEDLDEGDLDRPARHGEYGRLTLRDCVTLPLESIPSHLDQARFASSL